MKVKVILDNDIRRFVPQTTKSLQDSWRDLILFLEANFSDVAAGPAVAGGEAAVKFVIRYEDDEGDLVTVACEEDYRIALQFATDEGRKSLKLFLKPVEKLPEVKRPLQDETTKQQHHEENAQSSAGFSKAEQKHDDNDNDMQATHQHVTCDMCQMNPIVGYRYRCTECDDFDLCSSCESSFVDGAHVSHTTDHAMLKIRAMRDSASPRWGRGGRGGRFFNSKRRHHNHAGQYGSRFNSFGRWGSGRFNRWSGRGGHYQQQQQRIQQQQQQQIQQQQQQMQQLYQEQFQQQPWLAGSHNFGTLGSSSMQMQFGVPQPVPQPAHGGGMMFPASTTSAGTPSGAGGMSMPEIPMLVRSNSAPASPSTDTPSAGAESMNWRKVREDRKLKRMQTKHQRKMEKHATKIEKKFERMSQKMSKKMEKLKGKPKAEFVSHVTISPRSVCPPNSLIYKTWRFKNVGPCDWPDGCRLVFSHGDELTDVKDGAEVPPCKPGEMVDVTLPLKTPMKLGRFVSYYRLCCPTVKGWMSDENGKKFGPKVWVDFFISDTYEAENSGMNDIPPLEMAPDHKFSTEEGQQSVEGGVSGMEVSGEQEMIDSDIAEALAIEASLEDQMHGMSLETDVQIEGSPSPKPVSNAAAPEDVNEKSLDDLYSLGFRDVELNKQLLSQYNGDIQSVMRHILSDKFGSELEISKKE